MEFLAIALGGAAGALARSFVYLLFARTGHAAWFALPTLAVNTFGSFIIGIGFYLLIEHPLLPSPWKSFIITGFLGALTTFSTFSLDAFRMLQAGLAIEALVYTLASVLFCIFFTWAGYTATARLFS